MKKLIVILFVLISLLLTWCWYRKVNLTERWAKIWNVKFDNYWCKKDICHVKVTDKWIKRYHDKDYYLIYTNIGTFKIEDSLLFMNFSSSDAYWAIKIWSCYLFKTHPLSFRIPILSSYENIVGFKEVKCLDNLKKENNNSIKEKEKNKKTSLENCLESCNILKWKEEKQFCIKECIKKFK